jgi:hypothetical protein
MLMLFQPRRVLSRVSRSGFEGRLLERIPERP